MKRRLVRWPTLRSSSSAAPRVCFSASFVAGLVVASCNGEFRFDELNDGGADGGAGAADALAADVNDASALQSAGCSSDEACARFGLHCEVLSQSCVVCTDDAHCSGQRPRCDTALHRCVECGSEGDCPGGICDTKTRRCVRTCKADAGPGACPSGSECEDGRCRRCETDAKCGGATPVCEEDIGLCVQCHEAGDCSGAARRCDRTVGVCVECLVGADCPATRPVCDLSFQCQPL